MRRLFCLFLLLLIASTLSAEPTRLLRFPDIHNDQITFVYAGDIYASSRQGGVARRLTSGEGLELFPKFSPDGTQIVYTPIDREFRTWKRHRGGRAQDVWTYDLTTHSSRQLTDHRATDHQPLWAG
jgi:tricorn protease-like protein